MSILWTWIGRSWLLLVEPCTGSDVIWNIQTPKVPRGSAATITMHDACRLVTCPLSMTARCEFNSHICGYHGYQTTYVISSRVVARQAVSMLGDTLRHDVTM